jgi:RNA polymerase sigma-70 factor, ECF subfamily
MTALWLTKSAADHAVRIRRDGSRVTTTDFADFYAATFAPLTAQMHAFIGDHAEAQDLAQEAYARAYSRWSTIGGYDDPLGWVRRVAWNMAVSRWRRGRILRLWYRELLPESASAPSHLHVDLVRALGQLPANQRKAVVLHYLADMPVAEIATFMDAPEGTVKAWLHRGRTALSVGLGDGAEVSDGH